MNDNLEEKLAKANQQRELEQYGESAKLFTDCLVGQVDQQDYRGQIHSLCGQSLIYKILARKTNDQVYKDLCIALTKIAINILELHMDRIDTHTQSIAYSSFADALLMNDQLKECLPYFERALSMSPAADPEKGRLKAHIGEVKYLLGDKLEGISMINEGLKDIRTGDMNDYTIRVWETGALNSLTKIYAEENELEKAKSFNSESLKIATEHSLSIRLREAKEIDSKISSGDTKFSI